MANTYPRWHIDSNLSTREEIIDRIKGMKSLESKVKAAYQAFAYYPRITRVEKAKELLIESGALEKRPIAGMNIEGIIHTAQLIEQVFPDIPARLTNHVIKHELVMVPTQMVGVRAQLENYATEYFACEHMGLFLSYYGRSMIGKDGYLCYCVDGRPHEVLLQHL